MTAHTAERQALLDENARLQAELRQEMRDEIGPGVEGTQAAQSYDVLLRLEDEGSTFYDENTIHSLDLAEAISPIVRTYLRSNRAYWDSRSLGKGWVVQRDGQWLRCKGLMETHAPGMRQILNAEQAMRNESSLRRSGLSRGKALNPHTLKMFHGSVTRLRRSIRSYSSMMATCREYLIEPGDFFTALSLEWVLTITDRDGVIPDHILVADIGRAYQKAQHPGGLSWDDLRDELHEMGVVRSHSNLLKVPLADSLVREALQVRIESGR